jgi:membrane glycosyltransferase
VLDPRLNSLHVSLLHERRQARPRPSASLTLLCDRLLREGPSASLRDKKSLLWDADSMLNLHRRLWSSPAAQWHGWWRESFQNYLASLPQSGRTGA